MKQNRLVIFLFVCLFCGTVCGQTGLLYRVPASSGTNQIVRYEPITRKHITYAMSASGGNVFSLTDMNTLISVTIGNGLIVSDFEIIDGLVFFCGENGSGSGFIGWFDINDLFYTGGIAHIDQTLSALGLLTLDNIELYHDTTGDIRIAGYGIHSFYAPYERLYRAFEAVGTPATGMQYRTLDLWNTGKYGDVSDVVVTDNFVVYLSSDRNQACHPYVGIGITLQPFPKYDMFGNPPFYYHYFQCSRMSALFAYGYVLPINSDPYNNYIVNRVYPKMVHSVRDEIAVCTYRKDLEDSGWTTPPSGDCGDTLPEKAAYITHRTFDLSALVSNTNNSILMTSNVIAKLYNGGLYAIDDFVYEPQTGRYIVLHRHESSAGVVEHAVTTFNMGPPVQVESSYQTAFNTSSIWMPTSMCLDGAVYYTVTGYDNSNLEYMFWHNSVAPVAGGCDIMVPHTVIKLSLTQEKHYENNVDPTAWKPILFVKMNFREEQEFPCEINCE